VSARRILTARRLGPLRFEELKRLGVVLKRAQYFLTCGGKCLSGLRLGPETARRGLLLEERGSLPAPALEQLCLFAPGASPDLRASGISHST
jgi:predicted DNA-binding helix-hairpin-helix protein